MVGVPYSVWGMRGWQCCSVIRRCNLSHSDPSLIDNVDCRESCTLCTELQRMYEARCRDHSQSRMVEGQEGYDDNGGGKH